MKFSVYQSSHIGGRKYNQDRVAYAYTNEVLLLVLADGMGGHLHGELAAEITVKVYMEAFQNAAQTTLEEPIRFLTETMQLAHDSIVAYARENELAGNPGTTCVAAVVQDGKVCWAHAGDSRLYLLRKGEAVAVTHDHSVVQEWTDWGIITDAEMKTHPDRNKITNCLGGVGSLFFTEPNSSVPLETGDVLLLCSDGLWSPLLDSEIAGAFLTAPLPITSEQLIQVAVSREGVRADNTTAVVARWGQGEAEQTADSAQCFVLEVSELASASLVTGRTNASMKAFGSN